MAKFEDIPLSVIVLSKHMITYRNIMHVASLTMLFQRSRWKHLRLFCCFPLNFLSLHLKSKLKDPLLHFLISFQGLATNIVIKLSTNIATNIATNVVINVVTNILARPCRRSQNISYNICTYENVIDKLVFDTTS